ncbi:hypothetical protein [Bacillus infantis]|uniref:hypothetical protein n=1 Tax=Bacillus infantis TaxID=324767 RepID=UPI0021552A63|nr:hypothetical protein [Bacillus infantis]MCR6613361.1 hypothetical protein [Bacillus infantis]
MKKSIFVIMISAALLTIFDLNFNREEVSTKDSAEVRSERIEEVLMSAWNQFGLFSFSVGGTDPVIWIQMDENSSRQEFLAYLEKNISKKDLSHYTIKILKRSLQEVETEHAMTLLQGFATDYIKEKNYGDVQAHYSLDKSDAVLKVLIDSTSNLSSEELKTEIENYLAARKSELPKELRGILYEIQVTALV